MLVMINVAILIRGHIRNYRKLLQNFNEFKKLPNEYNLHIFIHTWNTTNFNNCIHVNKEILINDFNLDQDKLIIENQTEILNSNIFKKNRNRNKFKFQLYAIYKLKNLVLDFENSNNLKFNYIFFTRFDLIYLINLKNLIQKTANKIILFPKDVYYDIFCLLDRKFLEIYGNMILYNFKLIKKIYNSYGINPIIKFIIKKYTLEKELIRIAFIKR